MSRADVRITLAVKVDEAKWSREVFVFLGSHSKLGR